jgi:hypothetical protein
MAAWGNIQLLLEPKMGKFAEDIVATDIDKFSINNDKLTLDISALGLANNKLLEGNWVSLQRILCLLWCCCEKIQFE